MRVVHYTLQHMFASLGKKDSIALLVHGSSEK
jgi:hypothetical protein